MRKKSKKRKEQLCVSVVGASGDESICDVAWCDDCNTYRKERFRMVLWRASCDKLDRSSEPFCACINCVCELAFTSALSMFIEPVREFVFSIAAISSKQLKNDCFCLCDAFYRSIFWILFLFGFDIYNPQIVSISYIQIFFAAWRYFDDRWITDMVVVWL